MQSEELENFSHSVRSPGSDSPSMILREDSLNPLKLMEEEFKSVPSSDVKLEGIDLTEMLPESPVLSDHEELKLKFDEKRILKGLTEQNSNESIKAWLQRITQMQNEIQKKLQAASPNPNPVQQVTQPSRVVKYQDLPYMGEMTLDNSKPRRGRKPKKADICHLIYKNYGTIFPGTPKNVNPRHQEQKMLEENSRSDVQNRIISSLLEKRLTQENRRKVTKAKTQNPEIQREPLNLCIRDMDHLKIIMTKDKVKSEPLSDEDEDNDVEFVKETIQTGGNVVSGQRKGKLADASPVAIVPDGGRVPENGITPGYVYWPNAGVFIHPMALQQQLLYYQKMNSGGGVPSETPVSTPELRKLVPKTKEIQEDEIVVEHKVKRGNISGGDKTPTKRKRSAIFIPPIPSENPNNPATEVSICKFKFTGGAKPSLQEKKMLSVDAGGNFRYYSGTGDKSMRGYEFFPRETLQQQINTAHCSSTGAFLQASGEKIYPTSPAQEFMLTPEIQTPPALQNENPSPSRIKKRKSRKSLQREKLEQTFKEKGFLIQTQQLESAEGATYCKFRQLRKFTRYLFRSWKDYLPGNVSENQEEIERLEETDPETGSNVSTPTIESSATPPPSQQPQSPLQSHQAQQQQQQQPQTSQQQSSTIT